MRSVGLIVLIAFVAMAYTAPVEPKFYDLADAPELFEKFIKDNHRQYKDAADRKLHYDAFVKNLKYINKENAKGHSYVLGITLFADMTDEERRQRFGRRHLLPPIEKHFAV